MFGFEDQVQFVSSSYIRYREKIKKGTNDYHRLCRIVTRQGRLTDL